MQSDDEGALLPERCPRGGTLDAASLCPSCASDRLTQRHLARRVLGVIGTLAGGAGAGLRAWQGAHMGGAVGAPAGPPGIVLGAMSGAVIGAMAGASTGCAVGVRLGEAIDTRLLNCLHCGHDFNSTSATSV